jgi:hypothetical protein
MEPWTCDTGGRPERRQLADLLFRSSREMKLHPDPGLYSDRVCL